MWSFSANARKLADILAVPSWRRALARHRVAAGVEHVSVLHNLGAVRSVVDIGANRGQFALAARRCFPDADVVSFEPLSRPAARYRDVFANDDRVRLIEAAIGSQAGEATIHLSARDDSSSLLPIAAAQNALFPGTAETGTTTIRVCRLADEIQVQEIAAPALLKLDVQGFELQALEGCEEPLERFAWIYLECSFVELYVGQALADGVIAWLRERGFVLHGVYHLVYDASDRAAQADFLFGRDTCPESNG